MKTKNPASNKVSSPTIFDFQKADGYSRDKFLCLRWLQQTEALKVPRILDLVASWRPKALPVLEQIAGEQPILFISKRKALAGLGKESAAIGQITDRRDKLRERVKPT